MTSRVPQRDISQTSMVMKRTTICVSFSTAGRSYIPCPRNSPPRPASSPAVSRPYVSETYHLTFSADNFIDDVSESLQRRAEFQQEFRQLSSSQQQLLQEFVRGGCYSNLTLSRAKPCDRAQNANDLLTVIKALVSTKITYCICRCSS